MTATFDIIKDFVYAIGALSLPGVPWLTVNGLLAVCWVVTLIGVAVKATMYGDIAGK